MRDWGAARDGAEKGGGRLEGSLVWGWADGAEERELAWGTRLGCSGGPDTAVEGSPPSWARGAVGALPTMDGAADERNTCGVHVFGRAGVVAAPATEEERANNGTATDETLRKYGVKLLARLAVRRSGGTRWSNGQQGDGAADLLQQIEALRRPAVQPLRSVEDVVAFKRRHPAAVIAWLPSAAEEAEEAEAAAAAAAEEVEEAEEAASEAEDEADKAARGRALEQAKKRAVTLAAAATAAARRYQGHTDDDGSGGGGGGGGGGDTSPEGTTAAFRARFRRVAEWLHPSARYTFGEAPLSLLGDDASGERHRSDASWDPHDLGEAQHRLANTDTPEQRAAKLKARASELPLLPPTARKAARAMVRRLRDARLQWMKDHAHNTTDYEADGPQRAAITMMAMDQMDADTAAITGLDVGAGANDWVRDTRSGRLVPYVSSWHRDGTFYADDRLKGNPHASHAPNLQPEMTWAVGARFEQLGGGPKLAAAAAARAGVCGGLSAARDAPAVVRAVRAAFDVALLRWLVVDAAPLLAPMRAYGHNLTSYDGFHHEDEPGTTQHWDPSDGYLPQWPFAPRPLNALADSFLTALAPPNANVRGGSEYLAECGAVVGADGSAADAAADAAAAEHRKLRWPQPTHPEFMAVPKLLLFQYDPPDDYLAWWHRDGTQVLLRTHFLFAAAMKGRGLPAWLMRKSVSAEWHKMPHLDMPTSAMPAVGATSSIQMPYWLQGFGREMVAAPTWKVPYSRTQIAWQAPHFDDLVGWGAALAAQSDVAALTPPHVFSRVEYRGQHWKLWMPGDVRLVGGSTFAQDLAWAGGRSYYGVDQRAEQAMARAAALGRCADHATLEAIAGDALDEERSGVVLLYMHNSSDPSNSQYTLTRQIGLLVGRLAVALSTRLSPRPLNTSADFGAAEAAGVLTNATLVAELEAAAAAGDANATSRLAGLRDAAALGGARPAWPAWAGDVAAAGLDVDIDIDEAVGSGGSYYAPGAVVGDMDLAYHAYPPELFFDPPPPPPPRNLTAAWGLKRARVDTYGLPPSTDPEVVYELAVAEQERWIRARNASWGVFNKPGLYVGTSDLLFKLKVRQHFTACGAEPPAFAQPKLGALGRPVLGAERFVRYGGRYKQGECLKWMRKRSPFVSRRWDDIVAAIKENKAEAKRQREVMLPYNKTFGCTWGANASCDQIDQYGVPTRNRTFATLQVPHPACTADPLCGDVDITPKTGYLHGLETAGGVVKRVVRKGRPAAVYGRIAVGDQVYAHYDGFHANASWNHPNGTWNGSYPFDGSRNFNHPYQFTVGAGQVIGCWDVAVMTMTVGERAVITCRPDYAYATNGQYLKVNGHEYIQFDIEVLNVTIYAPEPRVYELQAPPLNETEDRHHLLWSNLTGDEWLESRNLGSFVVRRARNWYAGNATLRVEAARANGTLDTSYLDAPGMAAALSIPNGTVRAYPKYVRPKLDVAAKKAALKKAKASLMGKRALKKPPKVVKAAEKRVKAALAELEDEQNRKRRRAMGQEPTHRVFFDVVMSVHANHTPWSNRSDVLDKSEIGGSRVPVVRVPSLTGAHAAAVWQPVGRLVMELFGESLPATVENFRQLCVGHVGRTWRNGAAGVPRGYKGSQFFKIISDYMVQGGDYTFNNGDGGDSAAGGWFDDEKRNPVYPGNLMFSHDAPGYLSMGNRDWDANLSLFFITTQPYTEGDLRHVLFGRVTRASMKLVKWMETWGNDYDGTPSRLFKIADSGELDPYSKGQGGPVGLAAKKAKKASKKKASKKKSKMTGSLF